MEKTNGIYDRFVDAEDPNYVRVTYAIPHGGMPHEQRQHVAGIAAGYDGGPVLAVVDPKDRDGRIMFKATDTAQFKHTENGGTLKFKIKGTGERQLSTIVALEAALKPASPDDN